MALLKFDVEIAAPPDRVFAFFAPQRMPYWYGFDLNAEFEVQGGRIEFEVGEKVRVSGKVAGRELSLTAVITRYTRGVCLEWQFKDAHGVRGLQAWDLEPSRDATRVLMRDVYSFPGRIGRFMDALLLRHAVSRRDRLWLAKLKRLAERA